MAVWYVHEVKRSYKEAPTAIGMGSSSKISGSKRERPADAHKKAFMPPLPP